MNPTRTEQEIKDFFLERFESFKGSGLPEGLWIEFEGKLLIPYLGYKSLREIAEKTGLFDINKIDELKDSIEKEKIVPTKEAILKEIVDYLEFAYDKACGKRAISSIRSIHHFLVWFWLLGDDYFYNKLLQMMETNYAPYGLPILDAIVDYLNEKYEYNIDKKKLNWCYPAELDK